jgi:hypothetical protein
VTNFKAIEVEDALRNSAVTQVQVKKNSSKLKLIPMQKGQPRIQIRVREKEKKDKFFIKRVFKAIESNDLKTVEDYINRNHEGSEI